jgi:hypothetical protein
VSYNSIRDFCCYSEIRVVRTPDFGVLSGVVFMRVFGADNLLPLCYQRAPIALAIETQEAALAARNRGGGTQRR